jgi:hypothetical protein
MMAINKCFFMVCATLLISCSKKAVDADAYVQYINTPENGLLKKVDAGDFKIEVQLRPAEYMALQELGIDMATKEKLDSMMNGNNQEFFLLRIGSNGNKQDALINGISTEQEYFERIGYLISNIDKDVYLVDGTDTLRCAMHHFERSYHLASYHNVLLVFDGLKQHGGKRQDQFLVYDDKLLGIGKLNIRFDQKSINNIPNILL